MKQPNLNVQITGDKGVVDTFSMYDMVLAYSEDLGIDPSSITEVQNNSVHHPS